MESSQRLSSEYIAVEFNGNAKKLLNTFESVETSYPGSDYTPVEARYLTSGELNANESKTYTIKLWMDESVTVEDDAMNKSFISKIVVTAKQSHKVELADLVQLGDYVEMTPTSTSYTISKSMTGYSADQTINPSELNLWRVININEDGTVEMVSEYVSSTVVYLTGQTGYNNLVLTLQTIASQYANDAYTISTRHVGYNGQTYQVPGGNLSVCGKNIWNNGNNPTLEPKGCGDAWYTKDTNLIKNSLNTLTSKIFGTNENATYWLCSRGFATNDYYYYLVNIVSSIGDAYTASASPSEKNWLYTNDTSILSSSHPSTQSFGYRVRPIVTLKTNVLYEKGKGTKENPYRISINE